MSRPTTAIDPNAPIPPGADTTPWFESKINAKQRMFVQHLINDPDFNVANAAKAAGYTNGAASGTKLLQNEAVRWLLGKKISSRIEKMDVTAERVLRELACIGFFNPKELLDPNGVIKPLERMPDHVAACIQNIDVSYSEDEDGTLTKNVKLKFHDKMEALNSMAKHLGLFKEVMQLHANVQINWDSLITGQAPALEQVRQTDPIESKIRSIANLSHTIDQQLVKPPPRQVDAIIEPSYSQPVSPEEEEALLNDDDE